MPKKIISAILLAIALCADILCVYAFADTASLTNSGGNRYKAVRLTPGIYNNANPDLSDILVKDESGANIPYFINGGSPADNKASRQVYPMTLINAYTKNDSFYFDYQLSDFPERDTPATSIELSADAVTFAKSIEVFGGYDNINWEFVQSDTIYYVDGKSKLNIDFDKPNKYTHYRFKLDNNLEKISFNSVNLIYSVSGREMSYFVETLNPAFTVEEKEKTTYITIEGLKNLRLAEITVGTGSMFSRAVSAPFGVRKELYNLSFNDTLFTDTTIPFDRQISYDDYLIMSIYNGDDKPVGITGITVRYYADEIVFEDNGSANYSLQFGADNTKTAPVYDIVKYKDEILKTDIDMLSISGFTSEVYAEETEKYDYKLIFNIVIIAVAVLLGVSILFKLKK